MINVSSAARTAFPEAQSADEAKKFRDALRAEPNLLIIFRLRVSAAATSMRWSTLAWDSAQTLRFACLGDYVNSRGAADMGLLPNLLPGYMCR